MSGDRKTVFLARRFPDAVEARIAERYDVIRGSDDDRILTGPELAEKSRDADILFVCATENCRAETIAALSDRVSVIATLSVGYEHVDTEAAKARGIAVYNTPDVLSEATAEMGVLLLLAAARRASEGERMVRADAWPGWAPTQLLGRQVSGGTLGILGMGRIGRTLAQAARGLNMTVHYCNRSRLSPELEQGAVYHADPEELLSVSPFFVLTCPETDETRYFLNAERIARLPDGAVVVNIARGRLVVDADLIAALRSGKLFAAGLDVFDGEPRLNPEYRTLENVCLLPHLGSATVETRDAMGFILLDGMRATEEGRAPINRLV